MSANSPIKDELDSWVARYHAALANAKALVIHNQAFWFDNMADFDSYYQIKEQFDYSDKQMADEFPDLAAKNKIIDDHLEKHQKDVEIALSVIHESRHESLTLIGTYFGMAAAQAFKEKPDNEVILTHYHLSQDFRANQLDGSYVDFYNIDTGPLITAFSKRLGFISPQELYLELESCHRGITGFLERSALRNQKTAPDDDCAPNL